MGQMAQDFGSRIANPPEKTGSQRQLEAQEYAQITSRPGNSQSECRKRPMLLEETELRLYHKRQSLPDGVEPNRFFSLTESSPRRQCEYVNAQIPIP
jgi:hypothetical protein